VTEYRAIPASRLRDSDAQVIGEFCERKFGEFACTPSQLVAAARPKRSAIHDYFEWDDAVAANGYRLVQAEKLMRSIAVIVRDSDDEPVLTRAYHSVVMGGNDDAERAYVPQHIVWRQEPLAEQVVRAARRELEGWTNRYRQYAELAAEVLVVDELLAGMP
jgi:hypothetical protein